MRWLPLLFILSGCVQAPIAPNLKLPEQSCTRMDIPAIPDDVQISIKGKTVTANAGGSLLLRSYVAARDALK